MTFWLARPSPRHPTVEVRAADAVATVDEAVLQAALTQGLVRHALARIAAGGVAEPIPDQVGAAAVWTAARHGLDGPGVDPRTGRLTPASALLGELVDLVAPMVEDGTALRRLLARVLDRGTGAQRQRAAGDPAAAVDHLIELTAMEKK
jgi:carboxylate-amine ligase